MKDRINRSLKYDPERRNGQMDAENKESLEMIMISGLSELVRLAAHVSNGLKSRIHPVVGRI